MAGYDKIPESVVHKSSIRVKNFCCLFLKIQDHYESQISGTIVVYKINKQIKFKYGLDKR